MVDFTYQLKPDPYSSHSVILRYLAEGRGRKLLDVGAAQGYLARLLTERGFDVTCLEADPAMAEAATKHCSKVVIAELDIDRPELDGPFDVIVYGDVLEHLKDPTGLLVRLNEQLKPEGMVIVSMPNVAHLWMRWQLLRGKFEYSDRGILDRTHLRFYTLSSFRNLLESANLKVIKLTATPVPLPLVVPAKYQGRMFKAVHALNMALARSWKSLYAYQFVALAKKREAS